MEVIRPTVPATAWRKSSYSASNAGQCVEVSHTPHPLIRDSKITDSPLLAFSSGAFTALTVALKRSR